jgi:hypothetical protein
LDGVSLVPFIKNPQQLSFPTTPEQGTLNKTLAFSQYPHNLKNSAVAICPFFCDGSCRQLPGCGPNVRNGTSHPAHHPSAGAQSETPSTTEWMGFSVRDASWRYTCWVPYNGSRAQWPEAHPDEGYKAGTASDTCINMLIKSLN